MKVKKIPIKINTTQEFLDEKNINLDDIKEELNFLLSRFRKKYSQIFPTELSSNDIDYVIYCSNILKPLVNCEGFSRHIKAYNKAEIDSHLFTARVANYFLNQGYSVVLEPQMEKKENNSKWKTRDPHPDLKITKGNNKIFVECKTSDISRYFNEEKKKKVAEIVYKKVQTCDQLTLYFSSAINLNEVEVMFNDKNVIQKIHRCYEPGKDGKETTVKINEKLKINVIQRPAIIGDEEDFPIVNMQGFLEDKDSGKRLVGFSFMKGGRSIGVYELIDYQGKLKDKKDKSQGQLVEGYPNLVFLRDSDVAGDPELNRKYIKNEWMLPELENCSGVAMFEVYQRFDSSVSEKFKFYENPHAKFPINL